MPSKKIPDILSEYSGLEKHKQSVYRATNWVNIWVGAVAAGKTVTACHAWADNVLRCPVGSKHVIVGQTIDGARAVLLGDNLLEMFGNDIVRRQGYYELYGRIIYVMGAYDTRARQRLAGRSYWSALCDEVNTWTEEYWRFLRTRMRKPGKLEKTAEVPHARMYLTANPEGPLHWLKTAIDKGLEIGDWTAFQMGMRDNEFLDPAWVASMDADMKAAGPSFYSKYMLGEWVSAEEAIYPMLPDAVVDRVPVGVEILTAVVGADHGSRAATAFVYLGLGSDNRIYVMGEEYWDPRDKGTRLTVVEQAERYAGWVRGFPDGNPVVFVDPNATALAHAVSDVGSRVVLANNKVQPGIMETAALLGKGILKIVQPGCPKLVGEMSNYSWSQVAEKTGKFEPHKEADHACDALRYAVRGCYTWWQNELALSTRGEDEESHYGQV